jgi:uncharacterized SAM-binding protein YcdF (DUF218 family)
MNAQNHNQLSRAKVSRSRHLILLTFPFLALLLILALYAPHYLNYADQPAKADAVVLFLGKDKDIKARNMEADRLLSDGYANYLIIPALGQVISTSDKKPFQTKKSAATGRYPHFYENTHIEVLEAKRIMDYSGFKKANFVSSPPHMRRIKMITDHVFQQKNSAPDAYQINFVPMRAEPSLPKASPWDLKNIGNVVYEYIKIAWFYLYYLFTITDSK